ncbi:MAG: zinc-ribbon domain-containing protein [Oscillospiraceae bacterium]|nr:zinc-ribbon domain-containing protein [Oscillospiraceae bacterium]
MFCTNCGKQIPEGSRFCTNCGTKIVFEAAEKAAPEAPVFTPPAAPEQPAFTPPVAPVPPEAPVFTAPEAPAAPEAPEAPVFTAPEAPAAPEAPVFTAPEAPAAPEAPVFTAPPQPEAPVYTAPQQPVYAAPQQQAYAPRQPAYAPQQPAYAPQQPAYAAPAKQKKKGPKLGLIIGIIAAVVVIGALVACFLLGVFSGAKGTVGKAYKKSVKAYSAAVEALDPIDLNAISKSKQFSENIEFSLKEIDGDTTMKGAGARVSLSYDGDGREAYLVFTPYLSSADIATIRLALDDSRLYAGSPELTDGEFYGLDTKTIGRDIGELTGSDDLQNFGFNLFQIIDDLGKMTEDAVDKKGLEAANKALIKAIVVTKDGKESIDVNGRTVSAAKYNVKVPQKALENYVDALAKCVKVEKFADNFAALFESIGYDDYYVDDIRDSFDDLDLDDWADDIKDNVLDDLGDVEFKVFLSGGYISAFEYDNKIDETKVNLAGYFGGPGAYVDDMTLVASSKDGDLSEEFKIVSTGNRSGKGGAFTDTTKISAKSGDYKYTPLSSEISYDKKSGALSVRVKVDDGDTDIKLDGTLKMDAKSFDLDFSDLKIKDYYGDTVLGAQGKVRLGAYDKSAAFAVSGAKMFSDMSIEDISELSGRITENLSEISDETGVDFSFLGIGGSDEQRDSGIISGYDEGYEIGYQDGWDEVDYGENYDDDPASYGYSGGTAYREGFEEGFDWGYYDGYWDGYPGYTRYTSYGENRPATSTEGPGEEDDYTLGLSSGYDAAYETGYDDGWDEVDYGENYSDDPTLSDYYVDSPDFSRGYAEGYELGYEDGYEDGYPGYERYTSYGDSAWWWD